ncbi:transposase, partial [Vibrio agarivorans]
PNRSLVATLFRLEHHRTMEEFIALLRTLAKWLKQPERADLNRAVMEWLHRRAAAHFPGEVLPLFENATEGERTMSTAFEKWKQQHHQAGLEQGEQTLLRPLLQRRFGALAAPYRQRLDNAGTKELETWADRIFDARTLDDVFR